MINNYTLSYFIKHHETLTGSIIGALLAGIFGILTQVYINERKDKIEAEKVIELVKNEMDLNY